MRPYYDKYIILAMRVHSGIARKVDRFEIGETVQKLADYLASVDDGKHEQHLIMLASKWVKAL